MAAACENFREILDVDMAQVNFIKSIGSGTFANVYLAEWRGQQVAVKQYTQAQHMPFFEAETRQLARASHPNIVALYAKSTVQRVLIMEYSQMGALDNIIDNFDRYDYTAAHAISWARQAADGIAHLHSVQVLHRDLKPANMLLFRQGVLLKLTDFGTSCLQRTYLTSDRGSPAWMAPEVWHTNDYNEKCDVYSWAICFWQILSRQQPFNGCTMYQVMWKVINGDRLPMLKQCPAIVRNVIIDCWDGDKGSRPSMSIVAKKMAVLQKLYPGADQPIAVNMVQRQLEVANLEVQNEHNIESISSFETISESFDSSGSLMRDDLGSLAVVATPSSNQSSSNNSTTSNQMLSTLTPASPPLDTLHLPPGRRVSSASSARTNTPPPTLPVPLRPNLPNSASEPNIAADQQYQQRINVGSSNTNLARPVQQDPNGPISSLIFDHHVQLTQAFSRACAKIEELTRVKQQMSGDLDRARHEEHEAMQRVKEYQQVSAENEELTSLLTFLENNHQ